MIEILVYPADEVDEKIKKLEDVIEQSKKEKEWLIDKIAQAQFLTGLEARKERVIKEMQQALKEGANG